jgi:hypothetical protein
MIFSYSAVWEDTLKLTRRHLPLLVAIAGVFIFLPSLLLVALMPPPDFQGVNPNRIFPLLMDHYRAAAPWYLLAGLFAMLGGAAMLRLVFAREITVGGALAFALLLLPFYFLLQLFAGLMIGLGFVLLIVPGLYLIGRLAPATAVMVAEERRNPFDAIGRSFAITRGHGWAVLGIVFVVAIVGGITVSVADTLFGIIFHLAAPHDLARLLTAIVSCALNAALGTVIVMLYAAIYRGLTASDSVAATFE